MTFPPGISILQPCKMDFPPGNSILQPCSWFSFAEIGLSDFVRFPFRKKGMKNFYLFADR
jgi:hypothetical protein